jgi:hypothetical protein
MASVPDAGAAAGAAFDDFEACFLGFEKSIFGAGVNSAASSGIPDSRLFAEPHPATAKVNSREPTIPKIRIFMTF